MFKAQQVKMSSVGWIEGGMGAGGAVDEPANDPDAALILISSWKPYKGIPGVLDK